MSGTYASSAKGYVILTGTSHPDLANKIVARLATALGKASVYQKVNRALAYMRQGSLVCLRVRFMSV